MVADTEHAGICDQCQKRNYRTRKAAMVVVHRLDAEHVVAYRCPRTKRFWHVGHRPQPVIKRNREEAA